MLKISAHDLKLLRTMLDSLTLFQEKKIQLHLLINSLESSLQETGPVSEKWANKFLAEVTNLETINACSIDAGSFIAEGKNQVKKSVLQLKMIVTELIENYLTNVDTQIKETAVIGDSKWLLCPYCYDGWKSTSPDAMVECPNCGRVSHNPRLN